MRDDFIAILRRHGHTVVLQRRKPDSERGPYREIAGGRYMPVAEKWTVWRYFKGAAQRNEEMRFVDSGFIDGVDAIFYFEARANVKRGDLVMEDEPHEKAGRAVYRVEHTVMYYGYNGAEPVYQAVHGKLLDPIS